MAAYLAPATIGSAAYLAPAAPPISQPTPGDDVAPLFSGSLLYSSTSSSITIDWSGTTSSDNVAVARREFRIGGTGPYVAATAAEEASKTHTFSGLLGSTAYQIDVRCVDTSGNVSEALTIGVATSAPGGSTGGATNYVRAILATRTGAPHVNLASVSWSLFAQLLPGTFGQPVAKGTQAMVAGSPELKIAVSAAVVPAGWYMLAVSDLDGTTTVLSRVLVGP